MTVTPLCFIDTETTGVHPGRRPWEIAIIRRDDEGERQFVCQLTDVDLAEADPFGLKIGRFYERHCFYAPLMPPNVKLATEHEAARYVERWTRGAHIVGSVPNFDTETLDAMLRRHHLIPAWHYHLIDVENLAVGYWYGRYGNGPGQPVEAEGTAVALPWESDDLSRAIGVEPPSDEERHTALGDARWAMRMYDQITGGEK